MGPIPLTERTILEIDLQDRVFQRSVEGSCLVKKRNKRKADGKKAAKRALARSAGAGWRTSDEDEVARRAKRARDEPMNIRNLDEDERFFSSFAVLSESSGIIYEVEIRSLTETMNSCTCPDYRINGLGTCKHVEAVLHRLGEKPRLFRDASRRGSPKAEIYLRRVGNPAVRIDLPEPASPALLRFAGRFFDAWGELLGNPADAVPALERAISGLRPATRNRVRLAREVKEWAADLARQASREAARSAFEKDLEAGKRSIDLLHHPLYDYQRQGLMHLAFGERVMLVDDMGLGKTVQAIGACALLKELRGIRRVLVVSPASLKTEWKEQIGKFSDLPVEVIYGPKHQRVRKYRSRSFFHLANYEQILRDVREVNEHLAPDVVILDEAQRIKNWSTKTAQAVKRLASPYAFVLTGTPLENRIDEIYSITQFLDPHVFGPLFRFNREFYELDEKGRAAGYRNLDELRRRLRPIMLRRHKDEVEGELPERVDNNYFVEMTPEQRVPYSEYSTYVARLSNKAQQRPLTREESDKLMRWLACMRMLCDTTYILDNDSKISPKIEELERILEDVGVRNGRKALIFSEWERMLQLVRGLAEEMDLGYAWHTGDVPQRKRRDEINRFKTDPACKLFLSTDSGGVGLNLQAASVVINLDLPWNPAKLEQRIARAWRKHQKESVHVVNLITSGTIEHRMLATLAAKRELAEGVVDGRGDLSSLKMPSGREAFMNRLKLLMGDGLPPGGARPEPVPVAPEEEALPRERFRQNLLAELSNRVQLIEVRPAGNRETAGSDATLVVVDRDPEQVAGVVRRLHKEAYGGVPPGPVEVLDRRTYETLQRLADLGLVRFDGGAGAELHRSEGLKRPGPTPEEKRREKAAELAGEAGKKIRMGQVLADGGFPKEALAPVREAVELAVRALAVLSGIEEAGASADPVPAGAIRGKIVPPGFLTAGDADRIASLRELAGASSGIDDDTARSQVESGAGIVDHAMAVLAKAELGGERPKRE